MPDQLTSAGSLSRSRERAGVRVARTLRRSSTDAESLLWSRLRARQLAGLKFRRQRPLAGYVLDFVCLEAAVAIELDGGQHADPGKVARDAQRTRVIEAHGLRVLRFWNNDVLGNLEGVLQSIADAASPSPQPSPAQRERE